MSEVNYININNRKIAYRYYKGKGTAVLYVGGHTAEMEGDYKSNKIKDFCLENNIPYICFDYSGYGLSEGKPLRWQTETWAEELLSIIDNVVEEKVVLMGSSMGGYLMLLAALARPQEVKALIGMAAGFGSFLEEYKTEERTISLRQEGVILLIKKAYEPMEYNILSEEVKLNMPVTLFHGKQDDKVPWQATKTSESLIKSPNLKTIYIEDGDHFLRRDKDLEKIMAELRLQID